MIPREYKFSDFTVDVLFAIILSTMKGFSPHLFWDTDSENISIESHGIWLVTRVLEKGSWSDWTLLLKLMGESKIRETIPHIRFLEKKALNFICLYLNLDKTQLRCYKQQHSPNTHWNY